MLRWRVIVTACLLCVWLLPCMADAAERFTMTQAVDKALRDNPGLAASGAGALAAEEGRKAARGAFGPRLGTTYSASKTRQERTPAVSQRTPDLGTYSWTVNITQPLFTGFNLLSSYQKSALQADSEKAALRNARLLLTEQVQAYFLTYLRAKENVHSTGDSLARLRDQLRITQAFYGVGLRPKLDVLQAEVNVSEAESLLLQAANTRDTAHAMLNTLLGLAPTAQTEYVGTLQHVPFRRGLEQCLATAYDQRPDLYMAQKAVEIAAKDQKMVQSNYYPQVEGYYSINQYGNTPTLERSGKNGGEGRSWEVGAQATWNVFSWGTTYYADRQAGHNVSRLQHEAANARLNAGYDVKSKLLALKEAEKRIAVAQKGLEQAREAYDAALARYQAQVGTNFDVLDASSKLTAAQAALTGAKADYLTALASLYVAMGELHTDLMAR